MEDLKKITKIVQNILENDKSARECDFTLIQKVYTKMLAAEGVDGSCLTFDETIKSAKELGLPKFETITRARRKVQAKHRHLASSADVEAGRELNEEKFREYARTVI